MRLQFEDITFDAPSPIDEAMLVHLIYLCVLGRHRMLVVPPAAPHFHRWRQAQSKRISSLAQTALDSGLLEWSFNNVGRSLQITAGRPKTANAVSQMHCSTWTVEEAHDLATRPLRVLVENSRSDWSFLRKMVSPSWKEQFENAVTKRWIEVEAGCGITEIAAILEHLVAEKDLHRALRTFVLFDSDGISSGTCSLQSKRVVDLCTKHKIAFHKLHRRAIENYLPFSMLFEWANEASGRERRAIRKRLEAFKELTEEQRYFFPAKNGFGSNSIPPIFRSVNKRSLQVLSKGLGGGVGRLWAKAEARPLPADANKTDWDPERAEIFQKIMTNL